jgi:hypothetical protein
MADLRGVDDTAPIFVDVATLSGWADELRRLAGLRAASSLSSARPDAFLGAGTSGAWSLRQSNARGLGTLLGAIECLDDLMVRLGEAADLVSRVYPEVDGASAGALAKATAADVRLGLTGGQVSGVS